MTTLLNDLNVSGDLTISGSVANPITLAALPAGTNNIGDVDVLSLPALPAGTNNIGDVDVLTLPALVAGSALIGKVGVDQTTPGTTNAVSLAQIGATTVVNGGVAGTLAVGGVTAAAATATGNPVRLGAKAMTAAPTAVTDGQVSNVVTDKIGRLITTTAQCRDLIAVQSTTITASTSETTIVTAAASTFHDLTSLTITNSSATATLATLKDSTAGTTRAIYSIAANGGITIPFNPPLPQATVNTNWTITSSASVSSLYISAVFAKNI